jgi:hypothetical protein
VHESDLQYVAFKASKLHLAKIKCLEMPARSLKTRDSQNSTASSQQPGYVALPKPREALTMILKRPRSKCRTLVREVNPLRRPRNSVRLRNLYRGLDYVQQLKS